MNGTPDQFTKQGAASLAGRITKLSGASIWTFDYHQWSLDWVTDSHIGPALASAIVCLAHSSRHKVILVDHSMGGLATQYAVSQPDTLDAGHLIADDVEEVLTLGTPFLGSKLLSGLETGVVALPEPQGLAVQAILAACAGVTDITRAERWNDTPCATPAIADSPVGSALRFGSSQIAALPAWATSLRVRALGGQTNLVFGVRTSFLDATVTTDVGDELVTTASATADDSEHVGAGLAECSVSVIEAVGLKGGNPCYHGRLMTSPGLGNVIRNHIQADINAETGGGNWSGPMLTITPTSLGGVRVGMSLSEAQRAAGVVFDGMADGAFYPTTLPRTAQYLFVDGGSHDEVACVGADVTLGPTVGTQVVSTPEGFRLGQSTSALLAIYGTRARYVPSPATGIITYAGYVVRSSEGNLAFKLGGPANTQVIGIAGGGTDLGPDSCVG